MNLLTEEQIQSSTAEVYSGSEYLGTAWLLAPNVAMTAAHVVADISRKSLQANKFTLYFSGVKVDATIAAADVDFTYDAAILSLVQADRVVGIRPLPVATLQEVENASWKAFGSADGHNAGLWLTGVVNGYNGRAFRHIRAVQLECRGAKVHHLRGTSGAAIIVDGAVIGLVRRYPPEMADEHILFASRLDDVAESIPAVRERIAQSAKEREVQALSHRFDDFCRATINRWNELPYERLFTTSGTDRSAFPLVKMYVRQPFRRERGLTAYKRVVGESDSTSIDFAIKNYRHVLLQGDPGSGKTSTLRHLCVNLATEWIAGTQRARIPIYISAQRFAAKTSLDSLDERIRTLVSADLNVLVPEGFLRQSLPEDTTFLIVIDGLDEIPSSALREDLIQQISLESTRHRSKINFVIGSRPLADLQYSLTGQLFARFFLLPFDHRQAESLVSRWAAALKVDSKRAGEFIELAESSLIKGLLESPVMLTMAVLLYFRSNDESLPSSRADLYERFVSEILTISRKRMSISTVTAEWESGLAPSLKGGAETLIRKTRQLLEVAATSLQERGINRGAAIDELLNETFRAGWLTRSDYEEVEFEWLKAHGIPSILAYSGLTADDGRVLSFSHNTIREFLCASRFAKTSSNILAPDAAKLLNQWGDPRWREIALLALALWSKDPAQRQEVMRFLRKTQRVGARGVHFVGAAVVEGVQIPDEDIATLLSTLINQLSKWNSCGEFYNDFKSPDPIPLLRQLMRVPGCITEFRSAMLTLTTDCPRAMGRLMDLVYECADPTLLGQLARWAKSPEMRVESSKFVGTFEDREAALEILQGIAYNENLKALPRRRAFSFLCDLTNGESADSLLRRRDDGNVLRPLALLVRYELHGDEASLRLCFKILVEVTDTDKGKFFDLQERVCIALVKAGWVNQLYELICKDVDLIEDTCRGMLRSGSVSVSAAEAIVTWVKSESCGYSIRLAGAMALSNHGMSQEILADLHRLYAESTKDESNHFRIAEALASADDSQPMEEFANSPEVASWRRAQAVIRLARTKGTAYSLERLHELIKSHNTPKVQKLELAAALVAWNDDEAGLSVLRVLAKEPNYVRGVLNKFYEMGRALEIEAIAADFYGNSHDCAYAVGALKEIGALESLRRLSTSSNSSTIQLKAKEVIEETEKM